MSINTIKEKQKKMMLSVEWESRWSNVLRKAIYPVMKDKWEVE